MVDVIQLFQHLCRLSILSLCDIGLAQCLQISGIIGFQFCGLLDAIELLVLVFHGAVVGSQIEVSFRTRGVQFHAMAQQVKGSIVVALLPLTNSIQEESVVLLRGER